MHGNVVSSEWINVRSASLSWEKLFLIRSDDDYLYFYHAWEPDPVLSIAMNEIKNIVDCDALRQKSENKLKIECYLINGKWSQPYKSRLSKAFEVSEK